jgi:hypothetical protein
MRTLRAPPRIRPGSTIRRRAGDFMSNFDDPFDTDLAIARHKAGHDE